MGYSRSDETSREIFYEGHPPYCTCKECEERRLSTLTPAQRVKLKRIDKMIEGDFSDEDDDDWELYREFQYHTGKLGEAFHRQAKKGRVMALISHLEQRGYEVKVVEGYDSYKIMIR